MFSINGFRTKRLLGAGPGWDIWAELLFFQRVLQTVESESNFRLCNNMAA